MHRAGFHGEFKTGGELHGAQDAQRIFTEVGAIDGAQNAVFEIDTAVERIEDFPGKRVRPDGVDGEIAAARGLFKAGLGVSDDLETLVALAGFAVAPRSERLITSQPKNGEKIPVHVATHVAGVLAFQNGAVVQVGMSFDVAGHKHVPLEIYGMTTNVTTPVLYALGSLTTVFSFTVIGLFFLGLILLRRHRLRRTGA